MKDSSIRLAKPKSQHSWFLRVCALVLTMGTIWACGYLKPIDNSTQVQKVTSENPGLTPLYHDFDDILVPKAMQINRKMTRLSETQTMLTGVMSFEGNLDRSELVRFFKNNMVKDNWDRVDQLMGSRSLLQFEKHNRWCVMTITERPGGYGSQLEIWVIPKNKATSSGLIK